ncbi:MAG: hypothetical protein WCI94_23270 [Rhodospirillales bacterium]
MFTRCYSRFTKRCGIAIAALAIVAAHPSMADDRALISALTQSGILDPARIAQSVRRICNLKIGTEVLSVFDIVETIPGSGADTPTKAWRRAVAVAPDFKQRLEIPYWLPAHPIGCKGSILVFSAPVEIDNTQPAGRRVRLSANGRHARVIPDRN